MRLYRLLRAVKGLVKPNTADSNKITSTTTDGERVAAMTFDDGPCGLNCPNGRSLTSFICGTLAAYGFTATFNIIGTTAENYPDTPGKGFAWSGKKFDHYPRFGDDVFGGAVNNPSIIRQLLDNGNELANHGYRHIVSSKMSYPYHQRRYFKTTDEVIADYKRLHNYIEDNFGYTMIGARPPHYVDKLFSGGNVLGVYEQLDYNYYAASFDAGGWGSDDTPDNMIKRLEKLLQKDPNALCGGVIFQKDGLSMSGEMLIFEALPRQLRLLSDYGYSIVSVKKLLNTKK